MGTAEIIGAALNTGLFATLFCFLFIIHLKDSKEREKKFAATIDSLCEGLKAIVAVDKRCQDILTSISALQQGLKKPVKRQEKSLQDGCFAGSCVCE
ncbi:MAG: BhlA/UviB family holin-like peptide [Firmicutes bacterium]|nr:BhlA/UviB family holin-like peptide [Bacillota bacterium]